MNLRAAARLTTDARVTSILLLLSLLVLAAIFVAITGSMIKWDEIRWLPDDYCYLRQARLFHDGGLLGGLDTHLESETVRYLATVSKELGLGPLSGAGFANPPCHFFIDATGKLALQYPPGTGFMLWLFPEGVQVRALYVASSAVVLLIVLDVLLHARTATGIALVAALGSLTLLLMVNPSKGSYSMPPTMPICIALALLTVIMMEAKQPKVQLAITAALGIVLGLSVNIRIANALLAFGYLLVLAINFVRMRGRLQFLQGFVFCITFVAGILPTLVANAINAGSPFSTPYSAIDLVHDFSWASVSARIFAYGSGTRGAVLWAAILSTVAFWLCASRLRLEHARPIALLVTANLASNLAYYVTHVAYASYYAIPLAILSMWTLCFAFLASEKNSHPAPQAAPSVPRRVIAVSFAGATAAYVAFAMFRISPEVAPPRPPSIEDRSVVIWADLHAGMVAHHFERYSAKGIAHVTPETQDRVIGSIARDRRIQVFINDTDEMQRLIDRSAKFGTMRPAGRMFGYDVYSLVPRD